MFDNVQQRKSSTTPPPMPGITPLVASSVGSYVFETGKQRAAQALNIYAHIDYLRPYFDVEPKDVLNRLLNSFLPTKSNLESISNELYGPLMLIFTLSAILIYEMKLANHSVEDGTLIGTAFFVCFGYWLGLSALVTSFSFICNGSLALINILSLIGYSMFSHCLVLIVGTFIHTSFDHLLFYLLWLLVAGAAGLKLGLAIFVHIPEQKNKIIVSVLTMFIHMMFLLYLHFKYHDLAECNFSTKRVFKFYGHEFYFY